MKVLLNFGILLLICAKHGLSASIIVKREANNAEASNEINNLRKHLAEAAQIANMNELKYDDELEKKAKGMTCESLGSTGSNCVMAPFPDQNTFQQLANSPEGQNILFEIMKPLLMPKQTKFGCASLSPICNVQGVAIPGICLVGPNATASEADIKKGTPGSQCPNGKASGGLCNASSSILSSVFILILILIMSVNFI